MEEDEEKRAAVRDVKGRDRALMAPLLAGRKNDMIAVDALLLLVLVLMLFSASTLSYQDKRRERDLTSPRITKTVAAIADGLMMSKWRL